MEHEANNSTPAAPAPFSLEDIAFIHRVFHMELVTLEDLAFILAKPKLRQPLLDSRRLFDAILEIAGERVSPFLFHYVRVRQVLLHAGISDIELAEYLTSLILDLLSQDAEHIHARGLPFDPFRETTIKVFCHDLPDRRTVLVSIDVGAYRVQVDGCCYPETSSGKVNDS